MAEPRVVRNEERHRYEAWSGDVLAAVAEYRERGDRTVFTHTEVEPEFAGQGIATALAAAAIEDTVKRGRLIVPLCPFIDGHLAKHPEYEEHVRRPGITR